MSSASPSDPLRLGVATPERVALSLPVAGIGSRTGAWLVDAALMFLFWIALYFVFSLLADVLAVVQSLSGLLATLALLGVFAMQWLYWTAFEVFMNGQSPGKRLVGIRVVRLDGAPVGFLESAVRNLLRVVDFLPAGYAVGVITMLVNPQHRRLGDLAAGTLLIREEKVDLARYAPTDGPPPVGATAGAALRAEDAELILSFVERAPSLEPGARARLCSQLLARFGEDLGPEERERLSRAPDDAIAFLARRARG